MIGLCVTLFPPPPPPPSSQTSPHSSSGLWLTVCLRRQWPPLPPFCCVSSFLSRSRVMAVCHWPAPFPNLATEIFNNLVISPVTITPKSNLHITIAVSPFFFPGRCRSFLAQFLYIGRLGICSVDPLLFDPFFSSRPSSPPPPTTAGGDDSVPLAPSRAPLVFFRSPIALATWPACPPFFWPQDRSNRTNIYLMRRRCSVSVRYVSGSRLPSVRPFRSPIIGRSGPGRNRD
jgi:hypothetical protein